MNNFLNRVHITKRFKHSNIFKIFSLNFNKKIKKYNISDSPKFKNNSTFVIN